MKGTKKMEGKKILTWAMKMVTLGLKMSNFSTQSFPPPYPEHHFGVLRKRSSGMSRLFILENIYS